MQMNAMYELIIAQKKAKEAQTMSDIGGLKVKPKYEYDSDEDTTDGTWEHKKRQMEMNATRGRPCTVRSTPIQFCPPFVKCSTSIT